MYAGSAEVMAHELEEEELGGPSHTSAQAGLTLTVPSTSSPSQVTTQGAPTQDAPVAALRRYLDSIPQHPSPRREVRPKRAFLRLIFRPFLACSIYIMFRFGV